MNDPDLPKLFQNKHEDTVKLSDCDDNDVKGSFELVKSDLTYVKISTT